MLLLCVLLPACAAWRARPAAAPAAPLSASDWSAHPEAPIEWWYVAGANPAQGLVFHLSFFQAPLPPWTRVLGVPLRTLLPRTYTLVDLAVTDLQTQERHLEERTDFPWGGCASGGGPLRLRLGPTWLREVDEEGGFELRAGELSLSLRAAKPRILQPPGWSGGGPLGRLMYQSITRLSYRGSWRGRPVEGTAWMDHQWGAMLPGRDVRWDWHGLQLEDGSDLMLNALTRPDGTGLVLQGSVTDRDGRPRPLSGLRLEPLEIARVHGGTSYALGWAVSADGYDLRVRPLRLDQEFRSMTGLRYWEGGVLVEGSALGRPVRGVGMGEHLPWVARAGSAPSPAEALTRREAPPSGAPRSRPGGTVGAAHAHP